MALVGVHGLADGIEAGRFWESYIYKTTGPLNLGVRWGDASMAPGTPKYNAYVGSQFEATPLIGSGNNGIYTGPTPAPGESKYLTDIRLSTPQSTLVPSHWALCDYLQFYPLLDGDDTSEQLLVNAAPLPRYATGDGVQCFVVQTTPTLSNAILTLNYTNSDGVSGRSSSSLLITNTPTGAILTSANTTGSLASSQTPFFPLAGGDKGIRSIESATLAAGVGGFFALVLVKPLASIGVREVNTASELSMFMQMARCPIIYDGAYLNFIYLAGANTTTFNLFGRLSFTWG